MMGRSPFLFFILPKSSHRSPFLLSPPLARRYYTTSSQEHPPIPTNESQQADYEDSHSTSIDDPASVDQDNPKTPTERMLHNRLVLEKRIRSFEKERNTSAMLAEYERFKQTTTSFQPSPLTLYRLCSAANKEEEKYFQSSRSLSLTQRQSIRSTVFEIYNILKQQATPIPHYIHSYYWRACRRRGIIHDAINVYHELDQKNQLSTLTQREYELLISIAWNWCHQPFATRLVSDIKRYNIPLTPQMKFGLTEIFVGSICNLETLKNLWDFVREFVALGDNESTKVMLWRKCLLYDYSEGIEWFFTYYFVDDTNRLLDEGTTIKILESLARTRYSLPLAESVWHRFKSQNIPSPVVDNVLLFNYLNHASINQSISYLSTFTDLRASVSIVVARWLVSGLVPLNELTFKVDPSKVADGLNNIELSLQILCNRALDKKPITTVPFKILMQASGLIGDIKMTHKVFSTMEQLGLMATVNEFRTILEVTSILGMSDYAYQIVLDMQKRDIKGNLAIFIHLVNACTSKNSTLEDAIKAISLFINSSRDFEWNESPCASIFTRLISFLCSRGACELALKYIKIAENKFQLPRRDIIDTSAATILMDFHRTKKRNTLLNPLSVQSLYQSTEK